jgi:5-methylcytosine-specific restriction endonuclease McrA
MSEDTSSDYPPEAYALPGQLWWQLSKRPGTNRDFGDEPKIAAWLAFNKRPGEFFTTEELRTSLGSNLSEKSRNNKEHFQRRIRELRSKRDGWVFPSVKHDRNLDVGNYRLDKVGWHPALGNRPKDLSKVSAKNRRLVLERDHSRCFHCGAIATEPHPANPSKPTVLTVGHIVPVELGGSGEPSNLRAECAECNEASRSDTKAPESYEGLVTSIDNLSNAEKKRLLEWIERGHRSRDKVDSAYDRFRLLVGTDKSRFASHLRSTTRL